MKQNGFWKGFGSGLVLTVLIAALCVTATATSKRSIQVEDGIGITINGARFTPRDAAGKQVPVFLYNGTTYVPRPGHPARPWVWTCPSTRPPARSS